MDSSVRSLNALLVFLALCVVGLAALEMTLEAKALCGVAVTYQATPTPAFSGYNTPTPGFVGRNTPTPALQLRYTPTPGPDARYTPTPEG